MNRRQLLVALAAGGPIAAALASCGDTVARLKFGRDRLFGQTQPTVTLLDAAIDPMAESVDVTILVSGPVREPIQLEIRTRNGTDGDPRLQAIEGVSFVRTAATVTLNPGEGSRRTVAIPLLRGARAGQWFMVTSQLRSRGGRVQKSWCRIDFRHGAQTHPVGPFASQPPARGALTFSPVFARFQANEAGEVEGRPIWADRFRHGRTQDGNHEVGYYAPGQWTVRDGALVLKSSRLSRPIQVSIEGRSRQFSYLASVLTTRNLFSQQYGYFECEARTPSARGSWAAFWLLPMSGGWPPEIDIFEHPRNGQITAGTTTVAQHWLNGSARRSQGGAIRVVDQFLPRFDATTSFHTYALDWRADFTTWYIDGVEIFRAVTRFHRPAYIVLNVAVGGWAKRPNYAHGTTDMHIRRLQVWA